MKQRRLTRNRGRSRTATRHQCPSAIRPRLRDCSRVGLSAFGVQDDHRRQGYSVSVTRTVLVIPCFNEAQRLQPEPMLEFLDARADVHFVLVDDGSADATLSALRELAALRPTQCHVLANPHNVGKAESVRRGMLVARQSAPRYVGYWDCDLATPLAELRRFEQLLDEQPKLLVVTGARVKLLGRAIRRNELRHYLGRVFATLASMTLGLAVYDTQCGAKLFRAGPVVDTLFDRPFLSDWIFDVEILARLVAHHRQHGDADPRDVVRELPLQRWEDVPGSKVRLSSALRSALDLVRIYRRYLR